MPSTRAALAASFLRYFSPCQDPERRRPFGMFRERVLSSTVRNVPLHRAGYSVERGWGDRGLHSVGRGALRAQGLRMSSAECPALSGTAGALPASQPRF